MPPYYKEIGLYAKTCGEILREERMPGGSTVSEFFTKHRECSYICVSRVDAGVSLEDNSNGLRKH